MGGGGGQVQDILFYIVPKGYLNFNFFQYLDDAHLLYIYAAGNNL